MAGQQPGPAAQHGGQTQRQARQGQAQRQDEEVVGQVPYIKELGQQGAEERQQVDGPSKEHGAHRIRGGFTALRISAATVSALPSAPGTGISRWAMASSQMHWTSSGIT